MKNLTHTGTHARGLRSFLLLSLAALAVAGGAGSFSARQATVANRRATTALHGARAAAQRERRALAQGDVPTAAALGAARAEGDALAVAAATVPAARKPAVAAVVEAHSRGVAALASALAPAATPAQRAARIAAARALLDRADDLLANVPSPTGSPAPWPRDLLEDAEATALLLTALAGLSLLLRSVFRLVRRGTEGEAQTELDRLHDALRTDSLTGLHNHRAFHDDLTREIQRRNTTGSTFSLLALDLDGLKRVNDVRGHLAGDEYIRRVAATIAHEVSGKGLVYRTGGDEFMALLPNRRAWHALSLAHDIQRATTAAVGRRALSIGVTESTHTESARLLVHRADLALYQAKRHKLLAVTYHPGLEPEQPEAARPAGPTAQQKTLASALARAVDAKDVGTRNHSETVGELSVAIAARLGIEAAHLERIRLAGLLHDVGKIGVPDAVLRKPSSLAADERAELEQHVSVGHAILTAADLHVEAEWVLHHHERYDGEGYPARLSGERIPIEARIIAVADAFEAMTGRRSYRSCLSADQALAEVRSHRGTQFDPRCVDALEELLASEPSTTEPRLASVARGV